MRNKYEKRVPYLLRDTQSGDELELGFRFKHQLRNSAKMMFCMGSHGCQKRELDINSVFLMKLRTIAFRESVPFGIPQRKQKTSGSGFEWRLGTSVTDNGKTVNVMNSARVFLPLFHEQIKIVTFRKNIHVYISHEFQGLWKYQGLLKTILLDSAATKFLTLSQEINHERYVLQHPNVKQTECFSQKSAPRNH